MISFTVDELTYLLDLIQREHGRGYSRHASVAALQNKLAELRLAAVSLDRRSPEPFPLLQSQRETA